MKIKLNGEEKNIDQATITIADLLKLENVKMPEMVSVEHNGDMLERSAFDTTNVVENDAVEFLYFMGGGTL